MNKIELLEELKEVMQVDGEISFDTLLKDLEEWDSLANISTLSLYDELFNTIVTSDQLADCKTINELIELVADKLDA